MVGREYEAAVFLENRYFLIDLCEDGVRVVSEHRVDAAAQYELIAILLLDLDRVHAGLDLQRIQPGTGLMEIDRVSTMVEGRVFRAPVLGIKKAVLVCCEPQYMDLVIGQDIQTAYLELVDLNHHMRVLETVLPRLKEQEAVVVFE